MPIFFSFLPKEMPGSFFSTRKALAPRAPLVRSVRAMMVLNSASPALVIHCLVPLRT